jgi:hypothetical protein
MFALQGKSSHRPIEQPVTQLGWSAEWGGFASRGRVIAGPAPSAEIKSTINSPTTKSPAAKSKPNPKR